MEQNNSSVIEESKQAFVEAMRIKLEENKKALRKKGLSPYEFDKSKAQASDQKT